MIQRADKLGADAGRAEPPIEVVGEVRNVDGLVSWYAGVLARLVLDDLRRERDEQQKTKQAG